MFDEIANYLPVIGDIYRGFRIGYKISEWVSSDSSNPNDNIIEHLIKYEDDIVEAKDAESIISAFSNADNLVKQFDSENCKKYQGAMFCFLLAKLDYLRALLRMGVYNDDFKELYSCGKSFDESIEILKKVQDIEITLFTEEKQLVRTIREGANKLQKRIEQSITEWEQQCKEHFPWRYFVRAILLKILEIIAILALIFSIPIICIVTGS